MIGGPLARIDLGSPSGFRRYWRSVRKLHCGTPRSFRQENRQISGVPLGYADLFPYLLDIVPKTAPFVLVAESFSSPLAIKLAAMNPANLKGLVICAGFVKFPVTGWLRRMQALVRPFLFRFAAPRFVLEYFLVGAMVPGDLIDAVRRTLYSVSPTVIAGRIRAAMTCNLSGELSRVRVPILYLRADHDRLIMKSCFEEIQRVKPDTILATIPGPHLLLQREPCKAAVLIAQFLESLPSSSNLPATPPSNRPS